NEEGPGARPMFVAASRDFRDGTVGGAMSESIRGFQPKKIPLPITFYTAETRFTPVGTAAARELLTALREQNPRQVIIVGHTDERGASDYNMRLSHGRAEAVVRFLRDSGYSAPAVTVAKGKTEPVVLPNASGL